MSKNKIDSPDFDAKSPEDIDGFENTIYVPEVPEIEVVPGAKRGAKGKGGLDPYTEELLFNEEQVEVMVHESTDDNSENPVFTSCNGVPQYFYRGIPQTVRRKYVSILASCKEHNVTTPEMTAADGSRTTSIRRTSSLKYPFSIISDPNPRGAAWLKALLRSQT